MKLKNKSGISRKIEVNNVYIEVHPGELVDFPDGVTYDERNFQVDNSKKKTVQQIAKGIKDKAYKEKTRIDKINKTGVFTPPEELVEKEVEK